MFCLSLAWLVGAELSFVASGCRLLSDGNEFHRSLIDLPQKRVTKVERPDPVFDLFQGDVLSCQDFRDEHELAEELDFPPCFERNAPPYVRDTQAAEEALA